MTAVTFSDTVAQEFEKHPQEVVDAEFSVGEYQGQPSYTLNEIAGVRTSGFKKGAGFQKDIVSEERKTAANVAARLIEFGDAKALKNPIRGWEKLADEVYTWISKRPSEPEAAGGKTEQVPPGGDENAPAEV